MPVAYEIRGVAVSYAPSCMGGGIAPHDHFELRSEHMSETGYRSHFVPSGVVRAAGGAEIYAEALIEKFLREPDYQMVLF